MIGQGGVKVNGVAATALDIPRAELAGALVQAGKRRFVRYPACELTQNRQILLLSASRP